MGVGARSLEGVGVSASTPADRFASPFRGRRVLVTGHTGFVGGWLCAWLARSGALVTGLSLPSPSDGGGASDLAEVVEEVLGDVRDRSTVDEVVRRARPEVVFHLAAQALVLPSYEDPVATFATNVMGTVHLLDSLRHVPELARCVVVTSDKCYAPRPGPHRESDPLGGDDPYSASKAACEVVSHAFATSFPVPGRLVSTVRAGNILGGGDWSPHRILPDTVRALVARTPLELRRPRAVRPWQHVLDAVAGYLLVGSPEDERSGPWNLGPSAGDRATVGEVVALAESAWVSLGGDPLPSLTVGSRVPVSERDELSLDARRARDELRWIPQLDLPETVTWSVEWYHDVLAGPSSLPWAAHGHDLPKTTRQIEQYLALDARSASVLGAHAAAGR